MGNCIEINGRKSSEYLFPCCKLDTNSSEKNEINCVEKFINYYVNNKIRKYIIDLEKKVLIDTTIKSSQIEIKPSNLYFEIIEKSKGIIFLKKLFIKILNSKSYLKINRKKYK
jgi:hypothetical protein